MTMNNLKEKAQVKMLEVSNKLPLLRDITLNEVDYTIESIDCILNKFNEIQKYVSEISNIQEEMIHLHFENSIRKDWVVGQWWFCDDIPTIKYKDGKIYALSEFDGKNKFTDCWECVGEHKQNVGKSDLTFEVVYDDNGIAIDYNITEVM